jgi:hypothetical protein
MELTSSIRKSTIEVNAEYGTSISYKVAYKMVQNPMYCGIFRDNQNYCEPIISKEQFDKVQRLKKVNVRSGRQIHTYIFSGLLICDCCNTRMAGNHNYLRHKEYFAYRCIKAVMKLCDRKIATVPEREIEEYLLENVEDLLEKHITRRKKIEEKEKPLIKSNRKSIEKKLQRLNELYVNGFIDMEKYKTDYADLQSQIIDDESSEDKIDLTAAIKFLSTDFKPTYETLSRTEKQAMWRGIIKEIRVSTDRKFEIEFL